MSETAAPAMSRTAAKELAERLERDEPTIRSPDELRLVIAALRYYGNSRLREGLQWYADKENYATGQDCPDVLIDGGDLARRTLEQSVGKLTESTLPQTDVREWLKKNI